MPVRVSVDGENKIVRIEKKDDEFGATSLATAVEGAGNTRAYRFTFPFASLSGYLNGDRNSLVPVPASDIVKVHLTFAPRFEDVEYGLAAGWLLKNAVAASPPGTEEEWRVANAEAMLADLKYYVGTANAEERITCLGNFGLVKPDPEDPATWYCRLLVRRGEDSSTPQPWPPGTRIQRISTITGTRSDIEWQVRISNLTVTGDRMLKVGGDAPRVEESDGRCRYEGFWEDYRYGAGWPTQWWSLGHAKRCAPNDAQDRRAVTIRYSYPRGHDLYLGTWLGRDAGRIEVTIDDGTPTVHDLYLNDYNGLAAMKKLATALPGGTHTVEIQALFSKHPASTGYYFYFDFLWPLEPQDPPDPPKVYPDVSAAIDFDTDHGYKKPPAWHVWHLARLGFRGHADVYMGVFWNNKRRRIEATYPNCTVSIGAWQVDQPLWINLSGTTLYFSPGAGLATEDIAAHLRAMINVTFPGVWCTSDGGSVHIRSRAPSYTFTISASPQVSISQGHRVVSRIDVPSTPSLFYQFDYSTNADAGYGELDYMKTPYGAEVTYRYFQENLFKTLATLLKNPVKSKTVTHDGETDPAWQYQFNQGQSAITNPDGGVVTTYFYDPDILSDWRRGLVYKVVQPEGDVVERVWEQNKTWGLRSSSLADPNNPFVKKELSSVASNGLPVKTAITEFDQDKNGNLLERREYDWVPYGTTSGSVVRRRTTQTYYVTLPASSTLSDDASAYWRPHNASLWPDPLSGRRLNAVLRREIKDGSTVQAASEFEYDDAYRKGNLTKDKQWDSTKSAVLPGPGQFSTANAVILTRSYDSFGNLTEVFEPEVRTTLTYGSVCGAQSLYPTQIQQAPGLSEQRTMTYSWHCGTGLLASQTDVENGFTITYLYDRLGRRTETNEGNLRASTTAFDDGSRKVTAKADLRAFRAGELQTVTHYDQLGRVRLVRRSDGAPLSDTGETDGIKVQTVRRVAPGGNIEIVSNPYRTGAESTMGWTCSQQDRNGRVRWVGSFAGPVAPNSCLDAANRTGLAETRYQGDVTVSIDPANKQRDLARDALGRLVAVTEYTGGTPATYLTTYAYNALDNLMVVQQGGQSRSFVYSSLGRLISAYNPESGGVSYTYFDHGGLATRTDARSVTTTHSYDGLHRLRTKSYTDGTPGMTNEYYLAGNVPQVGRLKSVTSSVASTQYTYDALGRVTASTQTVTGSPYSYGFLYTWLLNDGLATMRYPSGRTITYTQDDAGRVVQVQDGSKLYAQGIGYTAHGAITQMQLGNGLVEQWLYNSRLQPASIRLGDVAGSDSAFGAALDYGATNNNGNLLSQRITGMGLDRTQTYQYDGVNRLIGSGELAVWSRNFAYDQQGNGWVSSASGLSTSSFTPVTSNWFNAQNRLTGMGATYDGAGNQTAIGGFAFSYDAENRLKTSTINNYTTTYFYDGEGRRVKKLLASGEQTLFIYDAMGQLAAEYTTGQSAHSGTRYLTVDHLGSIRAVTSQEKTVLARRDYLPFGEEIPPPLGGRTSVWAADAGLLQKFTGKERDSETGLDFFLARYYSGAQARFASVDPIWITKERMLDPQRLNLYAYGRNNPLRYIDPNGMDITLGRCEVGSTEECFARLLEGLKKEDRRHVRLVQGDGKNGFRQGEHGVVVDADYKSDSKNFQVLQKLANDHSATAAIDVLKGGSKFDLKVSVRFDIRTGEETFATMSTTPNDSGGFTGYTFFPQRTGVPGPYSTGNFTHVIVNSSRGWIPATIHHELRHVLLGDFGRVAPYGAHGTGRVDRETVEAEKEAVRNQVDFLRNQR